MNEVTFHRSVHGCVFFAPVREQLVQCRRLEDVSRKDMGANFRTLFHDDHGTTAIQLHEPASRSQACWPSAHDDDIEFHRLAFSCICHGCLFSGFFISTVF